MDAHDSNRPPPGDETLLRSARAADPVAIGALFDKYYPRAKEISRRMCTWVDAEDIAAEAFLRLVRGFHRGQGPETSFVAYLITVIRRLIIDSMARYGVEPLGDPPHQEATGLRPDRFDVEVPHGEQVRRAMRELPERWRMVLWYLDVEGMKPRELAGMLGMSANAVSALAYRARHSLR